MTDFPDVKLKALVNFPSQAVGRTGITVDKTAGNYFIDLDYERFQITPTIPAEDMPNSYNLIWDEVKQTFAKVPFALQATSGVSSIGGHTGALDIGTGLTFVGETLQADIATQAEAEAGTNNTDMMTPLRTAQEVETFLLDIPAWKHGVSGDGSTDQTAALQAIIDNIPVIDGVTSAYTGARILLKGTVVITSLDLKGKHNITFEGRGNINGPNYGLTYIQTNVGAIGANTPVIDAYGCTNIGFEGIGFYQPNAAFDGIFIAAGKSPKPTSDTARFHMSHCLMTGVSQVSTATLLWLYGATNARLDNVSFTCGAVAVQLMTGGTGAEVMFANNIRLLGCSFNPTGNSYPVKGIGDVVHFIGCSFQASTLDNIGRAYLSSGGMRPLRSVSFSACYFLDNSVAGEWVKIPWANVISVTNSYMSGPGYFMTIGGGSGSSVENNGVRGFVFTGNACENFTAVISFTGDVAPAVKTGCRGGFVGGNCLTNAALFQNTSSCINMVVLPNAISGAVNQYGQHMAFHALPAYPTRVDAVAAGLLTGQLYRTNVGPDFNIQIV